MRLVPTRRAGLVLLAGAVPLVLAARSPEVLATVAIADALLLALLLAEGLWLARRPAPELVRRGAGRLALGATSRITLELQERGGSARRLEVVDTPPAGMTARPERLAAEVPPHGTVRATYELRPHRRGRFGFGDVHVREAGPLGLCVVERVLPAAEEARVLPDVRAGARLLLAAATRDLVQLGARRVRRDGQGSELARLREYVAGDPPRDVDWKATARRGQPVTRVYETERSQPIVLCVDAGRAMAASDDGRTKLDAAIQAALLLAFVALRSGDRVGVAVFSDRLHAFVAPAGGRAQARRLLDTLYAVEPSPTATDYRALLRELGRRVRRRSLIGIFTDPVDDDPARSLVAPLRLAARRHVALALCLRDRALDALLRTPATEPEGAFRQVAATELLEERERRLLSLAEGGVHVLDAAPDELPLASVNRYLELKRRAVL